MKTVYKTFDGVTFEDKLAAKTHEDKIVMDFVKSKPDWEKAFEDADDMDDEYYFSEKTIVLKVAKMILEASNIA